MIWEIKKLGDVCEIGAGNSAPQDRSLFVNGKYPFIRTSDVGKIRNGYIKESADYLNDRGVRKLKLFRKGTLLFPKSGASTFLNHRVVMAIDGYVSSHLATIKAKESVLDDNYLFYFSLNINARDLMQDQNYPSLRLSDIQNIEILVPPLPIQKRIVAILDKAFESITQAKENSKTNLKNAKEVFESYLQKVFENKGEGWEEKTLGEICEMINRGVSPKYVESKGLCVLNQKCIRDHKIDFELSRIHGLKSKKVSIDKFIQVGDVLVNSTGTGTLGRVAQVRELSIQATVDSHITIVRPIKNMFYNEFFGYVLIFIEDEIAKKGAGCGGQTELARNTLKNDFTICYPVSLSEQKLMVKKLDKLSQETKQLESIYEKKLADLEELKKSILQKAFKGELTEVSS